ncbi:PTS system fructose-specific EIIABC component [uncultured Streptococcus sp.]|nr:PTS system fructose-specific EIIABC component [uncultured Streptococcus sp.]
MVPPIGVTFAWLGSKIINKRIFTNQETEAIKIAFPMGICMISEGVIPIAMNDLLRTVTATSIGCGVCGMISYVFDNGSPVPSGGVFVIPAMSKPLVAVAALLIGSVVTAVILLILKKNLTEEEASGIKEEVEEKVDLSDLSLS